jgi:hypothetical protein
MVLSKLPDNGMRSLIILTTAGFCVNEDDKCVYYRFSRGKGVIMCLYVDDILIFGTNLEAIMETKVFLSKNFDMKDLGEA